MKYSEVVNRGWVLPKKEKYTMSDVDSVISDSLFGKYGSGTLTEPKAKCIVRCSATYHDTDCSKEVWKNRDNSI